MADIEKSREKLLQLAEAQGYLTFDDILDTSDAFFLSVTEVDQLSEAIQLRGIIVYEESPHSIQLYVEDDEFTDFTRTDYEAIFNEVLELTPQLDPLISQIRKNPVPQYGEVDQLARQVVDGNSYARERVFCLYMRSVVKIALSMTKQFELSLEDAISNGFIGLMAAIDRYNPDGFSVFHSYASMYIRQAIQRDCNPVWMTYYFPTHMKEKVFRVIQKVEEYTPLTVTNNIPDIIIGLVAEDLQMPEVDVRSVLRYYFNQKFGRLDLYELTRKELFDEDDAIIDNSLMDDGNVVFEEISNKMLREAVNEVLGTLTPKEAEVLQMRYGMDYSTPMTLEEVGEQMHVSRERIRQIEAKALRKLRHPNRSKLLRDFLE